MPISTVIQTVDGSSNKTKVKLQFFTQDSDGDYINGSVLAKYVAVADEGDLPAGGTVMEQKTKEEKEFSLSPVLNNYINPPSLVFVDPSDVNAKQIGKWVAGRKQNQLTGVPATPDTEQMTTGVFLKLVEIMQANGLLPV